VNLPFNLMPGQSFFLAEAATNREKKNKYEREFQHNTMASTRYKVRSTKWNTPFLLFIS
jgi:hypothetical protein